MKIEVDKNVFCASLTSEDLKNEKTMDAFNQLMDEVQDSMIEEQYAISKTFGVSLDCADCIQYLRTRTRWTQRAEDELIAMDNRGEKMPEMNSWPSFDSDLRDFDPRKI